MKPTHSLIPNNFRCPKLFETQKGAFTKWFGTVRQKKSWFSAPRHEKDRHLKLSEIQKNPQRKDSVLRQNNSNGKSWFPPPPVFLTFFETRKFLKHRKVPLRNDSVLWDKTIWQKIVIRAPSLIPYIFRYPKLFETQKGSSTKWFGTVRHKFLTENRDTPSLPYP